MITSSLDTSDVSQISQLAIKKISYASHPIHNNNLRSNNEIVDLMTNLMNLRISENRQKLCLYSVSLNPELDRSQSHIH